jgi:hypothetical protein
VDRDRRLPLHAELRRNALASVEQAIGLQEGCITFQLRVVATTTAASGSPASAAELLAMMERHLERLHEWRGQLLDRQD